jgi:DNA repair photolyase
MRAIHRKSLIYKTKVEYGDYTINHVLGCSHGCRYPCYAMLMSKRFGRIKSYREWLQPRIVANAIQLLHREIPKLKEKIDSVHLSFMTDPFMVGYPHVADLSLCIIRELNRHNIRVTALTKGVYPRELTNGDVFSGRNEYGITLVSLNEKHRKQFEPYSATFIKRINGLRRLHEAGFRTWISIEPYPTPNIIRQDILHILRKVSFVDKIIFGRLNYNTQSTYYLNNKSFYNACCDEVVSFCKENNIEYHIKSGTYTG